MRAARTRDITKVFTLLCAAAAFCGPAVGSSPKLKSSVAPGRAQLTPIKAPQTIAPIDGAAAAEIRFENIGLSGAETGADDLEMILRFDGPLDGVQAENLTKRLPRWIAYATPGYDSLLIRTRKKAAFGIAQSATGFVLRLSWAADPESATRDNFQRLRLLTMTGQTSRARALLGELRKLPKDGDRLDRAEAELLVAEKDPRAGLRLYERLSTNNPEDLGLRRSMTTLRRELADYAEAELQRQSVEDGDTQTRLILRGRVGVGPTASVNAALETVDLSADAALRSDGTILPFDGTRAKLRASYDLDAGRGVVWSAVLHAGSPGAGIGGEVALRRATHEIAFKAAYHEPFFGVVEAIANDGTRSQIEASFSLRGSRRWSAGAALGYNWYALEGVDDAANAVALDAFARYEHRISERTTLLFSYMLDAEYVGHVETRLDGLGAAFAPMPLSDREVHSLGLGVYAEWDGGLNLDAIAGYSYDRFAEGGVFARANLNYDLSDAWRVFANAAYTEVNARGTGGGAVTSGGIGVTYRLEEPGAAFRSLQRGNGS